MFEFVESVLADASLWAQGVDWATAGAGVAAAVTLGLVRRLLRRTPAEASEELPPEEGLTQQLCDDLALAVRNGAHLHSHGGKTVAFPGAGRRWLNWLAYEAPWVRHNGIDPMPFLGRGQRRRVWRAVRDRVKSLRRETAESARTEARKKLGL